MKRSHVMRLAIAVIAVALAVSIAEPPASAQDNNLLEPPNPPRNVVVNPAVNSLNVFWDAPVIEGNNAPTGYIVRWDPGTHSGVTTFTSHGISNLIGGQTYSITVTAFNDEGRSISKPVEATPLVGADVTAIEVDEDSITETAAAATITLANPNSESLTVNVRYRTPINTGSWITAPAITTSGTTATASLTGLAGDSVYIVQASLDSNFIHYAAYDTFETDGAPGRPFLTLVPQDGTLTAQWTFEPNGGTVTSYLLEWKVNTAASFTESATPATTAAKHEITGLDNSLEYTARLTVNTNYGSATSDEVTVSPGIEPAVLYVEFGEIVGGSTFLIFGLVNLDTVGQTPLAFRLREEGHARWADTARAQFSAKSPTETYAQSFGLSSGAEHHFQFKLDEPGRESDWSKAAQFQFTTPAGAPRAPTNVMLTPGDGTITVNWSPPTRNGGSPVTGYSVRWGPEQGTGLTESWSVPAHERIYTITGLTNGVRYNVEVAARNAFGTGQAGSEFSTPSTVPQSEPYEVLGSAGCGTLSEIHWLHPLDMGGSPVTSYIVQWKTNRHASYSPERQGATSHAFNNARIHQREPETDYTFRVRAVNANGPASRLVTDPETMTMTTVPIWSEEVTVTPHVGLCIRGTRFGNALANSVPVIVDLDPLGGATTLHLRYREQRTNEWIGQLRRSVEADASSVSFDLRGLVPETVYVVQLSEHQDFPRSNSYRTAFRSGQASQDGFAGTTGSIARILRIEPSISSVSASPGDTVRLSVEVYGRQDIHDNGIADRAPAEGRPAFNWLATGISISEADIRSEWRNGIADDRTVIVTAPESPGTYEITAQPVGRNTCLGIREGETEPDRIARCTATFHLTVRRSSAVEPETPAPVNPPGTIPETLTDADGTAYAVFTPVEGGVFQGEGVEFEAGPGSVNNGEFIGIAVTKDGDASNVGQTHQRYTLGGSKYAVRVVDAGGVPVSEYDLDAPATICLPLPDMLRSDIGDLAILATGDGKLQVLSTTVRITADGVVVCGAVSRLPATVAVGARGAPEAIPDETATPVDSGQLPETGGAAPATSLMLLLLFIGTSITVLSFRGSLRRFVNRRGHYRSTFEKPRKDFPTRRRFN